MAKKMLAACAFVDWHNVQRFLSPRFHDDPRRLLPDLLLKIQQEIAQLLMKIDSTARYRATLRVYHGWHAGREATPVRRIFEGFASDPFLARRISGVSFSPGLQFGNDLACGGHRNPLYATFRRGGPDGGQKMVDTAIACDLLHMLRSGMADIGIIVSDDDDFVPVVFTADAWRLRAILLREPESTVAHITGEDCSTLVCHWRAP